MAGKVVETVSLKLDLQGFAQLQGLGNKFKKLENPIKLAGGGVTRLKNEIMGLGKVVPNTISHLNAQADALTRVRQTTEIGTQEFKELTAEINRVNQAITKANASMNKASFGRKDMFQGLGVAGGAMAFGGPLPGATGLIGGGISKAMGGSFKEGAISGVGVGFAAKPVVEAIGGTATYASNIEKLKIALKGITKDQASYEAALAAAKKATDDYNVPQEVAIKGMTRLSAAVLGAGGNIHNATEAFLNTTVAIKGTAGGAEDVKSAITAMVQIFSKGKVSAEELSGQLGERFPAAVTKFAKANNISTQQLQKNLKDGTVGLDMLSKFITSLGEEYEPLARKIAASNEEAGARSSIAMRRLKIAVGDNLKDVGAEFQIIGAELLIEFIPALEKVAEIAASAFGGLTGVLKPIAGQLDRIMEAVILLAGGAGFVALGNSIAFLTSGAVLPLFIKTLGRVRVAMRALRLEQMLNPLFAVGVGAAAVAVKIHKDSVALDEFAKDLRDGVISVEDATKKLQLMDQVLEEGIGNFDPQIVEWEKIFGPIGSEEELQKIRERIATIVKDLKDIGEGVKIEFKPPKPDDPDGDSSPLKSWAKDAFDFKARVEDVVVSAFKGMEDALVKFAQTGKLEFKALAQSILADMLRIMIRATIIKPLMQSMGLDIGLAKGGVIANNNIVPYRKGGVVGAPTMFRYGGTKLGIMGEAGPEAIMPLKRGPSGKLGVEMTGSRGAGRATTVNYTGPTLNFNGDEYVPKAAVGGIINSAATQGASMGQTQMMRTLQNSRSSRSRIGI